MGLLIPAQREIIDGKHRRHPCQLCRRKGCFMVNRKPGPLVLTHPVQAILILHPTGSPHPENDMVRQAPDSPHGFLPPSGVCHGRHGVNNESSVKITDIGPAHAMDGVV